MVATCGTKEQSGGQAIFQRPSFQVCVRNCKLFSVFDKKKKKKIACKVIKVDPRDENTMDQKRQI